MNIKKQQFTSKYSKSYKSMKNAEKAVNEFIKKNENWLKDVGFLRWIPTVDEEDPSRIIPVFIIPKGNINFSPTWFAEAGFPVM